MPDQIDEALRLIAIYLPQFHPIPENDKWWGKGFTEWTNVAKAKPLFRGHYQPHVPADMGFYDLRLAETRAEQAELARAYGIGGFCYYHYWFEGKRLIERPFAEVLRSGEPDFPFCLCWANETWSRRWQGEERDILMAQTYSDEDDRAHARWLMEAAADRRYIRVHGRPLFMVYRPRHMPDAKRSMDTFREEFVKGGMAEPYLVGVASFQRDKNFKDIGFDATMNFLPDFGQLPLVGADWYSKKRVLRNLRFKSISGHTRIYDYEEAIRLMWDGRPSYEHFPSVLVSWDNSARRGDKGIVMVDCTPERFERHLREAVASVKGRVPEERIVFLNAWNEWAEGNHLEPDLRHGRGFLDAVKRVRASSG